MGNKQAAEQAEKEIRSEILGLRNEIAEIKRSVEALQVNKGVSQDEKESPRSVTQAFLNMKGNQNFEDAFSKLCYALDRNFDEKISFKEFKDLDEVLIKEFYKQLDANKDGTLSPEELKQMFVLADGETLDVDRVVELTKALRKKLRDDFVWEIERLCRAIDRNYDGVIDFKEFQVQHEATSKMFFDQLDVNKDGVLSQAELEKMFTIEIDGVDYYDEARVMEVTEQVNKTLTEKFDAAFEKLFKLADANANGAIDLAEFGTVYPMATKTFYKQLDADNNKTLSKEEFRAIFVMADNYLDTPRVMEFTKQIQNEKNAQEIRE